MNAIDELESLRQEVELLKQRMKYLEDTFSTLADMNKSGEIGQYIAQRQRALAASKLVNAAAGSQKLNADVQQQVIDQLAAEKATMDARIEEAIRAAEQNAPAEDDLAEQFIYRDVPGGVEIDGLNGFNTSGKLVVPEKFMGKPVLYIGKEAFKNTKFDEVYLPTCLTRICEDAFSSCFNLKYISLPDGLEVIRDSAFRRCGRLRRITLPESLKTIGAFSFAETGIESIVIPDRITVLRRGVFSRCGFLKKVILGKGIKTIESDVFENVRISKLVIPKDVEDIDIGAFGHFRESKINVAVLGMNTAIKAIPDNIEIYCMPGSRIQMQARITGKNVRPLSEFRNE